MTETPANDKRTAIIQQAYNVFYRQGFQGTAVDSVLAETGISKRTLYKYFSSKEALIAAAVGYYQAQTFHALQTELERRAKKPRDKLLAVFDIKAEAMAAGDFTGCFAINAKLEYEGKDKGIEGACLSFMDALKGCVLLLCREAGYAKPELLATQYMIIMEGAIVYSQAKRDPAIMRAAKKIAQALLE